MTSRTLASVSGRTAQYSTDALANSSETANPSASQRPRKRIKKLKDDPPPAKTESVYSDDPVPASSGVFSPSIPDFVLEKSFPSILSTANLMRALKGPHGIIGQQSLGLVFLSGLRTIVSSMADLPHGVYLDPRYEVAQYTVMYAGSLLEKQFDRQKTAKDLDVATRSEYSATMRLVDTILETLRTFLKVVGQLFAENKPLPALPLHFGDTCGIENTPSGGEDSTGEGKGPAGKEDESLLNVVRDVIKREEELHLSTEDDDVKRKSKSGVLVYRVVRRRAKVKGSLAAQFAASALTLVDPAPVATVAHFSASSLTLVDPVPVATVSKGSSVSTPKESSTAEDEEQPAGIPCLPRRSAIYYLADPYNPEEDVDMPLPTEETIAVWFDQKGDMKIASLTALVRILTTIEGVTIQEFIPIFFVCFRFFTSPRLFLEALIDRFNEQPPNNFNPLQLEVWVRSRVNDHIRIAKTVLLWLELYWKSDVDGDVLPDLQHFVIHHLIFVIPPGLGDAVLEALDLVDGDTPFCRRSRKAHDLNFIYNHGGRTEIPHNDFTIKINPDHLTGKQLLSFDSPSGREEFARQITVYVSEQFRQVDPEDAIKYWHLKELEPDDVKVDAMEAGQILRAIIEFERALCSWVTFSVLDEISRTNRRIFIEFWLDVSARCLRLRNFSGAHCILVGLSNGSITRLKHTVLKANLSSKQQFRVLQKFFSGHDNYARYREVLSSVEPTVPMLAPLIRDVVSALNVIPDVVSAATKAGNKTQSKADNETQSKADDETQSKADDETQSKADDETQSKADDETQSKADEETQSKAGHKTQSTKNMINLCSYRVVLKTVRAMESYLIPYELTKNDDFRVWLEPILQRFPSNVEAQLQDNFYVQSKTVEAKDGALNHIHDPWNYIVRGELADKYTLHELPPVSSLKRPKKKNRLAAFFRKV